MTIELYEYERRKARLEAALRDAVTHDNLALKSDVENELAALEKMYDELSTDEKEHAGTVQLRALQGVLRDLTEKSGISVSSTFGSFGCSLYRSLLIGDCVRSDGDCLEVWSSGSWGNQDVRECTWPYEVTLDIKKFKADFRADALPIFNRLRREKHAALEALVKQTLAELPKFEGDVE